MLAYVDSSVVVAILLIEPGADRYREYLQRYDHLVSSVLLEAEVLAAAKRNNIERDAARENINRITLVMPDRPLSAELDALFAYGYCRGADAFHLATAHYLDPRRDELTFVTADVPQAKLASKCGFTTFR